MRAAKAAGRKPTKFSRFALAFQPRLGGISAFCPSSASRDGNQLVPSSVWISARLAYLTIVDLGRSCSDDHTLAGNELTPSSPPELDSMTAPLRPSVLMLMMPAAGPWIRYSSMGVHFPAFSQTVRTGRPR